MRSLDFVADEVFLDQHTWGSVIGKAYFQNGELESIDVNMLSFVYCETEHSEEIPVRLSSETVIAVCESIEDRLRFRESVGHTDTIYCESLTIDSSKVRYEIVGHAEAVH